MKRKQSNEQMRVDRELFEFESRATRSDVRCQQQIKIVLLEWPSGAKNRKKSEPLATNFGA